MLLLTKTATSQTNHDQKEVTYTFTTMAAYKNSYLKKIRKKWILPYQRDHSGITGKYSVVSNCLKRNWKDAVDEDKQFS